ncbi:SpoIIE family protein phosphatase [Pseudodesulfovibrio sp.]|uniref:PP2C family protein-serine/threonine phosphatase n=1 Tax=Pseudodesulfovibrio sp. TaxID=2035812 RepID=UPI00261505A2|nr:SpoIIE family protein phosphatase [Pseudodesulfovibrio sp.]MDD3312929.1 SpoIIE family protein phosphatase [Pseudodesulfovibrio sp.]
MKPVSSTLRAAAYYAMAVFGGTLYGARVCPFMTKLPSWMLGAAILAPLVAAFCLRGVAERALVEPAPPVRRGRRQFRVELGLFILAGLVSALGLFLVFGLPFMESGLKLAVGLFTLGVFAALDLALAREREVIGEAARGGASYDPPVRFTPMTRTVALAAVLILFLVTVVILLVLLRDVGLFALQGPHPDAVASFSRTVLREVIVVISLLLLLGVNLVFSYARNLRLLFALETGVLERVSRGDLTRQVPVITNNELGVIAGHTNEMIRALREGMRMREGLLIAREIQQHFLPDHAPDLPGLEMAGTARFSDETGGDFFDFIECEQPGCTRYGVVIGDVSGHGIGAALLMAAGRALVRQSASMPAPLSRRMDMANRHLARDVCESGRFITLFFMEMDHGAGRAAWVNAGHQPPLVYDPAADGFSELKGEDIPLGVEQSWLYHEHEAALPAPGQVLVLTTDGVWEAVNDLGEMFGGERLREAIRSAASGSARDILRAVVRRLHEFTGQTAQRDDVTLVVIKGVERPQEAA